MGHLDHIAYLLYLRLIAPVLLLAMGSYAIYTIKTRWQQYGRAFHCVLICNSVLFTALGLADAAASISELFR